MTLIIGKSSNLSNHLSKKIKESYLVSSFDPLSEIKPLNINKEHSVNIIFNNFQKSSLLNDLSRPEKYIQRSIMTTADILNYCNNNEIKINKVIYTSSSSVYGNNIFCKESDQLMPSSLHSSLKITNEKLIENFCTQYNIDYTICRIFNMYGGDDNFSIISKIIESVKINKELILFNNGNAIRDFIHVEDVSTIYEILLSVKNIPILNIGTSTGISIKSVIEYLTLKNIVINYSTKSRNELSISTCDSSLLMKLIPNTKFISLFEYILQQVLNANK